jgi:hypothetical protein
MMKAIAKSEEITASLRDPADWLIAFDPLPDINGLLQSSTAV